MEGPSERQDARNRKFKLLLWAVFFASGCLFLLSIALLFGLGTTGIIVAGVQNNCTDRDPATLCVRDGLILDELNATDPIISRMFIEYTYWMAGATGCSFIVALFGTLTFFFLVEASVHSDSMKDQVGDNTIDVVGKDRYVSWGKTKMQHFTPAAILTTYLSFLSLSFAILCALWGIAIAYSEVNILQSTVSTYIIVEALFGLILPIFLIIFGILLSTVLEFLTVGVIDSRNGIVSLLPLVKLKKGVKNDYWVISSHFYFPLSKPEQVTSNCWYWCDKSRYTWYLTAVVSMAVLLSTLYFADASIATQRSVRSCGSIDASYDCFNRSTFKLVNCQDPEQARYVSQLHCFKFLQFGRDVDVFATMGGCFAIYAGTVILFSRTFALANLLLHLRQTRLWGLGLVTIGVFVLAVFVVLLSVADVEQDIITTIQFGFVGFFAIISGVLVLEGKRWDKKADDDKSISSPPLLQPPTEHEGVELRNIRNRDGGDVELAGLQNQSAA